MKQRLEKIARRVLKRIKRRREENPDRKEIHLGPNEFIDLVNYYLMNNSPEISKLICTESDEHYRYELPYTDYKVFTYTSLPLTNHEDELCVVR